MKIDKPCYGLSPSQDVSYLQCRYSLFKRVINILTSISLSEEVDWELMKKAYNLLIERNDCLRIRFFKKKGQLMQYIDDAKPVKEIPLLTFATKEQQDAFINKTRKKAIAYLRGKVIEPYFIKTYDNKCMIFCKVCHMSLDIYGINMIFKDLIAIYRALQNGTEMPTPLASFEEVIKHDIERGKNASVSEKSRSFFTNLLADNPEPFYAGLHGPDNKIWQKKLAHHHRGMKMFFIHNDTRDYRHKIDAELVRRVFAYCAENHYSPANLLFYACSLTAARLNNNARNLLPLELFNCRTTRMDKDCAGTKVQSAACYTKFAYHESFADNFKVFSSQQFKLLRHVGFSDREFESLLHSTYRSSMLESYYFMTYSFIPFSMTDGVEFDLYTNGNGALPAYIVQLYNMDTNEILMAYDVQTKTTTEEHIRSFHAQYLSVLHQVLDNPEIKLRDIEI